MFRIVLHLCLLLLAAGGLRPTLAQSLRLDIEVREATRRAVVPFANLLLQPGDRGATTNERGRMTWQLPAGAYTVDISYLGYADQQLAVNLRADTLLEVVLVEDATELSTVIVSDRDASAAVERPLMGVERLSSRQIELLPPALGEVDILRGLQLLAGVSSAGEASNGLSIRGGAVDQNLVLLDKAPLFNPTHLFGLFSVFTPDALGTVDLYRGHVPARFGGRVASVLDVQLRPPVVDRTRWRGGIGIVSSRLSVETPLVKDKLYGMAAVRAGYNDIWFKLIERLRSTQANFADATVKLHYRPADRHHLNLTGFYSKDFYQLDLLTSFANVTAERNQYDYYTLNGTLDWLYTLRPGAYLQTTVVASDFLPRIRFPELGADNRIVYQSRVRYQQVSSIFNWEAGEHHRASLGMQVNRYRIAPGELLPNGSTNVIAVSLADEYAMEAALFAEDEWSPTENFTLSAGLRYAQYGQFGPVRQRDYAPGRTPSEATAGELTVYDRGAVVKTYGGLEPRLSVRLKTGQRSSIKAAYTLTRQYVQQIYNATTPLPTARWKTADRYVLPQRSQLGSVGFYRTLAAEQLSLSVEAYYRLIDRVLEYKPGADFFLSDFVETQILQGQGRAMGIETSLAKPSGRFTGWLNYTYARAQQQVDGPTFRERINRGEWYNANFDRPHTLNASIRLVGNQHNAVAFNFVLQSGRPYTIPNGFARIDEVTVPIFLERNNDRLPTYHRLDFSWQIHNPSMRERRWVGDWTFTVYNLYGRKNAYNIYYGPRPGNLGHIFGSSPLGAYRISIFAAPIVSLTYNFKFS